jgi:hypothetical protein
LSRSMAIVLTTVLVLVVSYWGFRFVANSQPTTSVPADHQVASAAGVSRAAPVPAQASPAIPTLDAAALSPSASVASAPPSSPRFVLDIVIARGGAAPFHTLKVSKGDVVAISVDSDEAGKLEVHGYRKELDVTPQARASMTFAADRTGRFPIDLHGSSGAHIEAAALEVLPR